MSEPAAASVPWDVLQKLAPLAEQLGISLPGLVQFAPQVDVDAPPRALALELGRLAAKRNLYFRGADELLTVDESTGDTRAMRPARFTTWMAEFCAFFKMDRGAKKEAGLTRETATLVLESDTFRGCLRRLDAINLVRLPVIRTDEARTVELLSAGYDPEARVLTVDTLDFETDWPLARAKEFLNAELEGYPWSEKAEATADKPFSVDSSRNAGVQIAAIVGTFCRAMFPPGTPRPMVAYIANQPGTGKSTLATMALAPVHETVHANKTPKDDEIMDKELETVAQTMQPFVFFDDIGYGIKSNPLNRFITSRAHSGRVMGGNREMFRVPAVTQVFCTGNDIELTPDLMRRGMFAELFLASEVRGRQFPKVISPSTLAKPETRKRYLAACYALVRHWADVEDQHRHFKPLESFEEWTAIVAGIVVSAGYADPLAEPNLARGGDEEGGDLRELFVALASKAEANCVFNRKELVEEARELGLCESLVGNKGAKDLDSKENKRLGRQLQKWRGREFTDEHGRRFAFGHKRQKHGATYPLTFQSSGSAAVAPSSTAAKPPESPP